MSFVNDVKFKLKRCPYCGKLPQLAGLDNILGNIDTYRIACTNGYCWVAPKIEDESLQVAVVGWNDRPRSSKEKAIRYVTMKIVQYRHR